MGDQLLLVETERESGTGGPYPGLKFKFKKVSIREICQTKNFNPFLHFYEYHY